MGPGVQGLVEAWSRGGAGGGVQRAQLWHSLGSNPSCPSSPAPVALNPIPNTVHSRTVQACPLKRGMKRLKLK